MKRIVLVSKKTGEAICYDTVFKHNEFDMRLKDYSIMNGIEVKVEEVA